MCHLAAPLFFFGPMGEEIQEVLTTPLEDFGVPRIARSEARLRVVDPLNTSPTLPEHKHARWTPRPPVVSLAWRKTH